MPMLIEHIDAIARKKQRDVLYITFEAPKLAHAPSGDAENSDDEDVDWGWDSSFDWKNDPMRQQVCQWLTEQQIAWSPCGYMANENCMISYQGQILKRIYCELSRRI